MILVTTRTSRMTRDPSFLYQLLTYVKWHTGWFNDQRVLHLQQLASVINISRVCHFVYVLISGSGRHMFPFLMTKFLPSLSDLIAPDILIL
jgi:hypothetical protein